MYKQWATWKKSGSFEWCTPQQGGGGDGAGRQLFLKRTITFLFLLSICSRSLQKV